MTDYDSHTPTDPQHLLIWRCREVGTNATLRDIEALARDFAPAAPHIGGEDALRIPIIGTAASSGLDLIEAEAAFRTGFDAGKGDPMIWDPARADRVAENLARKIANREADQRLAAILAAENPEPPFAIGLLKDLDAPPTQWRIEGLLPEGGRVTQVAQNKAGKTTCALNVAHSLITGRDFLGRFKVNPLSGNVAWLNYEVSEGTAKAWAEQVGVPGDRLVVVSLRGRRNPFSHEGDREELARLLREYDTEFLIPDPFSGAYPGTDQNSASEVNAWLRGGLDRFLDDTGITGGCLMPVHAGWNGERTRGSSALEDWPDAKWYLTKDDKTEQRFFRAHGRDVDSPENMLSFDPATKRLTLTNSGSRKHVGDEAKIESLIPVLEKYLDRHPGQSVSAIEKGLRALGVSFTTGIPAKALRRMVEKGLAVEKAGPKNAKCYAPQMFLDLDREAS